MGSFSVFHWAIVIAILGGLVAAAVAIQRAYRRRTPPDGAGELRGFGGWLLLLAVGVCLGPVRTLGTLAKEQAAMPADVRQEFPLMVHGEVVLLLAFTALQVAVAVQMLRRRASFRRWFLAFFVAVCVLVPLDLLWVCGTLRAQTGVGFGVTFAAAVTPDVVVQYIAAVIGVGLWSLYVVRSRRVANTFVGGRP